MSLTVSLAQEGIKVPKGKPIMIDGIFSSNEWTDAKSITINFQTKLHFKQSDEYVFIGVEPPLADFKSGWIDLYLSDNSDTIRNLNLHASRKLGERILQKEEWKDWEQWWGNEGKWRANYTRPKDVGTGTEQKTVPLSDNGWEFQIRKSAFEEGDWKLLVYASMILEKFETIEYPKGARTTDNSAWLTMKF